jgi:hypothetical protein
MSEIVYVFANPAMPDYIKVGRTNRDDVERRLKELSNHSGVPAPFVCLYAAEVADAEKVEDALHVAFDVDRPNKKREFFTTAPDRIIALLEAFAVSPDESASVQEEFDKITDSEDKSAQTRIAEINERRSRLKFSEINIPLGAELVFVKDETKRCRVVDDRRVEYEGETITLSRLAMTLSHSPTLVHGGRFFTYEGERLTDRRDRLEGQDET